MQNKKRKMMNNRKRKFGEPINIVICGCREYNDFEKLADCLDALLKNVRVGTIITGGCRGADTMAHAYARHKGYKTKVILAKWKMQGRAAGPIRNTKMARAGHATIAFVSKNSNGTLDMIRQAAEHEHEYIHIEKI